MPGLREAYLQVYKNQLLLEKEDEASVSVKLSTDSKPRSYSLSDDNAKEVLKSVSNFSYNIEEHIQNWVSSAGWSSQEAKNELAPRLLSIIKRNIDIHNPETAKLLRDSILTLIKNKKYVKIFEKSLANKSTNFMDFFNHGISSRYINDIFNNNNLISEIIKLQFAEGSVGVGAGEVFITLFSEAKNPSKGDLILPNGIKIELKSGGGRPGKVSQTTASRGVKSMINYLEKVHQTTKKQQKPKIEKNIENLVNALQAYEEENYFSAPEITKINTYVYDLLENDIEDIVLSKDKTNTIQNILNRKKINLNFIELIEDINYYNTLKMGIGYTDNFYKFFDYIYKEGIQQNLQTVIDIIKLFINRKIDSATENFIKRTLLEAKNQDYRKIAAVLITGLQIADYADEDGFNYIVFFDPNKKKQVVIENDETVINVLKQFLTAKDFVTIRPGTGGGGPSGEGGGSRGGFNVKVR